MIYAFRATTYGKATARSARHHCKHDASVCVTDADAMLRAPPLKGEEGYLILYDSNKAKHTI